MSEGKPSGGIAKATTGRPCPICGKQAEEAFRPFCSARCQDVDLHRWLTGFYAIPAIDDSQPGGEEEPE